MVGNGKTPPPVRRRRRRYRKQYPGEMKGITEEMRFVAMKLRNSGKKKGEENLSVDDKELEKNGEKEENSSLDKANYDSNRKGETWQPSMEGFLKYLVDSKLVFSTVERIVDESSDVSYVYFRKTGLERSECLSKDLDWFSRQGNSIPQPSNPGVTYAQYLEELAEKSPPLFLCHFYNIYFSHIAGGQVIAKQKLEVAEFSGLRSSGCVTFAKNARETSFFDAVAAQITPKTTGSTPVKGQTVAKLKVAINGFGRIGRNFLRCWHGRKDSPLEVIVVNDSGGVKNASHLLKYDSMLGTFKADVKIVDNETISVDGKPIKVVSNRDPLKLPWAELGIDIVIEGTGVFVDGPGAGKHIQAGAKKVIITAPAKGADIPTYVVGVNEQDYGHDVANIISNASCTTNCLAPFVKVMDEELGIVKGTMTTTHSYTGDQRLLDASHRDLRRARAAALNIVPTSTGAAKAVSLVLPQLKGKLNGIALRVPTPNVSVVDLVVNVEKKGITAEDVNAAFRKAADGPLKGILDVCDVPLVSVDFRCSDVSSTIDSSLTMVMGDDMVKVVAWYDNEWGYSQRVVDLAHLVANKWPGVAAQGSGDPLEDFCETNPADKECKVFEA
ncbi:glyceraldehyde-3-phosphate dehydrogenase B [Forsythia ovata]|uniref:glyceraldehyde-3-phosphate dehydrogenase (NADP(+)) (phosphorylating) n=1 Tax=Forsythia ovata TaxID=205694 RepID=A0ABD1VMR2_9LAMI